MARSRNDLVDAIAAEDAASPPIGHNRPPSPVELLAEQLAETYGAELAKSEPLATRANAAPDVIASDADLATWAEIGRDAAKLHKSLDEARLNEKRPVVALVDKYFEGALTRVNRISIAAVQRATVWNKKKAAEARAAQEAEQKRLREEAETARERARIAAEFDDVDQAVDAAGTAAAVEEQIADAPVQSAADLTRVRTESGVLATTATTWDFEIVDAGKIDLNAIRLFIDSKAIETAIRKIVRTQKGATKIEGVRVFEKETAQFRD